MPLSTPSPAPAPPAPLLPPPSEHLIRHLRAGSDSVHLPPPRMPDIVPIVRRPVKKLNSPPIFDKRSEPETSQGLGRKFGLPSDKSSGNSGNGSRVKRICEGNLPVKSKALSRKEEEELPVSVSLPKYSASDFVSAQQKRNVVPELRVAEAGQRVAKTTVSLFIFLPLSSNSACRGAFNACYSSLKSQTFSRALRRMKVSHALPCTGRVNGGLYFTQDGKCTY